MEDVEAYVGKLKVVELREELKKRGLPYAGVKSVLAQRLQEAMAKDLEDQDAEENQTENTEQSEEQTEDPEQTEEQTEDPEQTEEQTEDPEQTEEQTEDPEQTEEPVDGDVQEPVANEDETEPEQTSDEADLQVVDQVGEEEAENAPEADTSSDAQKPEDTDPITQDSNEDQMEAEPTEPTPQEPVVESQPEQTNETDPMPTTTTTDSTGNTTDEPATEGNDTATSDSKDEDVSHEEEASRTQTEGDEQKMETSVEETKATPEETDKQPQLGTKRSHDELEATKTEEKKKPDPSKAPDPEEPEEFDDSQVLMNDEFCPPEDDSLVTLDKYTSDLYFNICTDGLGGCGLTEKGFSRMWASARASWGVKGGKYYYEVKIEENISVDMSENEQHPHAIRVGWAVDEAQKSLGEDKFSYGYGGTGRKSTENNFDMYGESFGPGDIIGCFVDLESSPGSVSFSKNGTLFETAFTLETISDKTLYPCVSTKNVSFSVNFGGSPVWCEVGDADGYGFIQEATEEHKIRAPQGPSSTSDCEVIMLIGLPASGKTTWAEKQCTDYPDKCYTILGTNLIMERMKVSGLSRKENYRARFEALIKVATDTLNKLFLLAAKNNRNYIIDQTNVYRNAQVRKMKYFEGFLHKAVVVVPPHHELRRRTAIRNVDMGGPIPEDAVNAMKANFHIPRVDDVFQEVSFSEIYGIAADKIVRQYREDALGLPSYPQSKRGRFDQRGGGPRYGPPHRGGGGYSGYQQHSYSPRQQYGYGGGPYGYSPRPRYSQYGNPNPMYGAPRGYPPSHSQYRSPYNSPGQYRGGGYGGTPPPRRGGGGGYYGRY